MSESPPGLDLEQLRPWFRERVAAVDDPSTALRARLRARVIGHGRFSRHRRLKSAA